MRNFGGFEMNHAKHFNGQLKPLILQSATHTMGEKSREIKNMVGNITFNVTLNSN